MRKYGFAALCCVAAVALLGGCNKNHDKCCGDCKDKAAVKMDAGTGAASEGKCAAGCKKKCCADKAAVKMDTGSGATAEGKCSTKKAGCCAGKSAQNN
jgi:hypothetical protein